MKQEQFTYAMIKSLFAMAEENDGLIFYVRNWDYLLSYDDKGVWIRG